MRGSALHNSNILLMFYLFVFIFSQLRCYYMEDHSWNAKDICFTWNLPGGLSPLLFQIIINLHVKLYASFIFFLPVIFELQANHKLLFHRWSELTALYRPWKLFWILNVKMQDYQLARSHNHWKNTGDLLVWSAILKIFTHDATETTLSNPPNPKIFFELGGLTQPSSPFSFVDDGNRGNGDVGATNEW